MPNPPPPSSERTCVRACDIYIILQVEFCTIQESSTIFAHNLLLCDYLFSALMAKRRRVSNSEATELWTNPDCKGCYDGCVNDGDSAAFCSELCAC